MSNMPQPAIVGATETANQPIYRGRMDFFSVLLRAVAGELYKIRRRTMSKVLLIIAVLTMIIVFGFMLMSSFVVADATSTASCSGSSSNQCTETASAHLQAEALASASLRLPASLTLSVNVISFIGLILLVILAGTIVGGEYSVGTIRLLLTRGPTRTQFLLAKVLAILISVACAVVLLVLIGIICGAIYNLATGVGTSFDFLTGVWLLHALAYMAIAILGLFVYTMIAFNLATLGKATAAGVAGALIWWVLENILGSLLPFIGAMNHGPIGSFLTSIPDYLIGNNISVLLAHQSNALNGNADQGGQLAVNGHVLTDLHAILVLIAYAVIFIGIAWWVHQRRDITN